MNIAIDLRSLHNGAVSGVENYMLNVLEHALARDQKNRYTLFYNAFRGHHVHNLQFINSTLVARHVPNKILNLSLKLFNYPKFENFIGDFDCLFLPNLNQYSVQPATKVVITVHDLSPVVLPECYSVKGRVWHSFLNIRRLLTRADRIIAVSEYTKYDIIRLFNIPEEKVSVVYEGVNHRMFNRNIPDKTLRYVRNYYGLPGDFILFLATVEPRKNLTGLIQAFEQLDEPCHLVVAGKLGWKYEGIFRAMAQSKKSRFIKYLGYVKESHKPALMKLARVFAFPSFYEGFGLPPLEAMAVGTPVVTSQATSIPEVVGNAGILINPHHVEDLALGLYHALTDEQLRGKMIAEGFKQAERFTWGETADKVLGVFDGIRS